MYTLSNTNKNGLIALGSIVIFSMIYMMPARATEESGWTITKTDIFQPLTKRNVVIGSGDDVYLYHEKNPWLSHYRSGGKISQIGRKGEGPGEFQLILRTMYSPQSKRLYVSSFPRLTHSHVFHQDGKLDETIKFPDIQAVFPLKTIHGWVYLEIKDRSKLWLAGEHFAEARKLLEWEEKSVEPKVSTDSLGIKLKRNLIKKGTYLEVSHDQEVFYFNRPGTFEILFFDAKNGTQYATYKGENVAIPIDETWIEQETEKSQKLFDKVDGGIIQLKSEVVADYFPAVKRLVIGPQRSLLVYHALHFVHEDARPLILNKKGEEISLPYSTPALERLVEVRGQWAWLMTFDNQEQEAGLIKLPVTAVDDYVRDHPILVE